MRARCTGSPSAVCMPAEVIEKSVVPADTFKPSLTWFLYCTRPLMVATTVVSSHEADITFPLVCITP